MMRVDEKAGQILTPGEQSLLRAYRSADDIARADMIMFTQVISDAHPRNIAPVLKLVPGGMS